MKYYFNKTVFNTSFNETIGKVSEELKKEGFGILSDIDVQATLKNKINIDFRKYRILGACNPSFAYKSLQAEINIGTILPCNVVVLEKDDGKVSVSVIDPLASMLAIGNTELNTVAKEIRRKLENVINSI